MVDHFPQTLRNVLFESHKILSLLEKKSHEGYMYMMGVKLFPQNMLWEKIGVSHQAPLHCSGNPHGSC